MASIFSRIVSGELPAYVLAEDELHMAILDINPLVQGHVLVFPKQEVDYLFDVDHASYHALMDFAKRIAIRLRELVPCTRIGVSVIGLEVPHVHIHLIPINKIRVVSDAEAKKVQPKQNQNKLLNFNILN